jgi:hypothetical protein
MVLKPVGKRKTKRHRRLRKVMRGLQGGKRNTNSSRYTAAHLCYRKISILSALCPSKFLFLSLSLAPPPSPHASYPLLFNISGAVQIATLRIACASAFTSLAAPQSASLICTSSFGFKLYTWESSYRRDLRYAHGRFW